ncbi:hypothetical protein KSD_77790 [Ktedonobacter sp. SOSP1-85]|uniref:helix-turn-helix domain-containing protein n=1 Tax=Ktedonobacter sp. SOSP1-85 TaxID=2778367 RepID=UPI00191509C7|nr:helix-turn-helix domain-containing protein [Ktedonobacter sp. SOSP1-85]GHO80008.1 hypothetical protein KSD_77790 [Ktedonobacter sp. SOSP1-85]
MSVKKAAESLPNTLLRKARQERGWTQKELADLIDVPQSFMISRWENGTTYPGPIYREKLSAIFGKGYKDLGLYRSTPTLVPDGAQKQIIDHAIPVRQPGDPPLIGRDHLLEQIIHDLCSENHGSFIGINGLPGVGKTMLAMEVASSARVQEHFPDGVLWTTLGPRPEVSAELQRWGALLGINHVKAEVLQQVDDWFQILQQAIRGRQMLLILDDVWNIKDALPFTIGGTECAYLLTTRIPEVAARFAGKEAMHVPELTNAESMQLFKQIVPALVEQELEVVPKIVQAAGGLPLTLALMGNTLLVQMRHRQRRRLEGALKRMQLPEERMRLTQMQVVSHQQNGPTTIPMSIRETIALNELLLDEPARQALYALSVFPTKPATFSEEAALAVIAACRDTLDQLVDAGLLECNEEDRYLLHRSISDYAQSQNACTQAERRLVDYVLNYVTRHREDDQLLQREYSIILAALKIASRSEYRTELADLLTLPIK